MTLIPRSPLWTKYAAWGCVAGAALHVAAIFGGGGWFDFLGAPPSYGEAMRAGNWTHPVLTTLAITALLLVWAAYAFSTLPTRKPLPLAKFACAAVAVIFLIRGAIGIPLLLYVLTKTGPTALTLFHLGASVFILTLGVGFASAFMQIWDMRH